MFWNPYRVFFKGLRFDAPYRNQKNTTGYGDNDVDSSIFEKDGWRLVEEQKL